MYKAKGFGYFPNLFIQFEAVFSHIKLMLNNQDHGRDTSFIEVHELCTCFLPLRFVKYQ